MTTTDMTKNKGAKAMTAEAPKTTATAAPATHAAPNTAPVASKSAKKADDDEDMIEFNTGFTRTDGFWQNPSEGETIHGILLGERRVSAGSALKSPYYIFELTKPLAKMTTRIDPNKPGTKDNQQVIAGEVGKNVGVRASFNLQGLMRRLGHKFTITYLGKVPTKSGNTVAKFDVKFSREIKKEIEIVNERAAEQAHDEEVTDEAIPF